MPRADSSGRGSRKSGAGAILSGLNQPSGVVIALETRELADRHVAAAVMSIKPLPGNVVAQIKSSTVITSLNGVAYGLVQNSLDAQASRINLSVDYRRGNCTVEDNGQGIPPLDFHEDGGLGKLYCTFETPVMLVPPSHRSCVCQIPQNTRPALIVTVDMVPFWHPSGRCL